MKYIIIQNSLGVLFFGQWISEFARYWLFFNQSALSKRLSCLRAYLSDINRFASLCRIIICYFYNDQCKRHKESRKKCRMVIKVFLLPKQHILENLKTMNSPAMYQKHISKDFRCLILLVDDFRLLYVRKFNLK